MCRADRHGRATPGHDGGSDESLAMSVGIASTRMLPFCIRYFEASAFAKLCATGERPQKGDRMRPHSRWSWPENEPATREGCGELMDE